jgi:[ribosomal protein S18]-alanine N-acetyltransferase
MDEISIREMREDDVPQILTIENASFSTPWTEAAFLHEIHKPYALNLVLLVGTRLAGYLCLNFVFEEGHILNLAVHADFRRRGLATLLMRDGLTELKKKGCRFIYLEVRGSNNVAQTFYERFGFKVVGLRKKYYTNPIEDAVVMMRQP